MTPEMLKAAVNRSKNLSLSLSAYVQRLVQKDLDRRGPIQIEEVNSENDGLAAAAAEILASPHLNDLLRAGACPPPSPAIPPAGAVHCGKGRRKKPSPAG
jgi:hypothetical protein